MHGLRYSLKQYFKISRTEWGNILWTSIAFAFILTFRKWGTGEEFDLATGLLNFALALFLALIAMTAHVSLQKSVAIRLGYVATYTYWVNGLLISVFMVFLTSGYSGYIGFIIPGSISIELIPKLRLGKWRFGPNLKDLARVALAGPVANIILVLVAGIFYFATRSDVLFMFIYINLFLALYSILPIPKIDMPSKMDAGSDGLGLFYFSRTLYILVVVTIAVFTALVLTSINNVGAGWLFIIALVIGSVFSWVFSSTIEQSN